MTRTVKNLNRRSFLQTTAVGVGALATPMLATRAAAAGGELNFMGWAGYPALAETVFPAFTAATGITVNFNEQPDQDTMFAQGKVALEAGGIDMIEPTIDRVGAWDTNGLLGAWDESKLAMDNYLPGLADGNAGERSRKGGMLKYVPSNWGTEALVYNKESAVLGDPASLAALFDPANQVVLRPHSALAAPYHRLSAGILAAHEMFASAPDDARRMLVQRGVTYVVTCGPRPPTGLAQSLATSKLNAAVGAKTCASPVQPRRSSRCGAIGRRFEEEHRARRAGLELRVFARRHTRYREDALLDAVEINLHGRRRRRSRLAGGGGSGGS